MLKEDEIIEAEAGLAIKWLKKNFGRLIFGLALSFVTYAAGWISNNISSSRHINRVESKIDSSNISHDEQFSVLQDNQQQMIVQSNTGPLYDSIISQGWQIREIKRDQTEMSVDMNYFQANTTTDIREIRTDIKEVLRQQRLGMADTTNLLFKNYSWPYTGKFTAPLTMIMPASSDSILFSH